MNRDYEVMKAELWAQAWCACCSSSNVTRKSVCDEYADHAVEQFEKRFKEKLEPKP